MTYSNTCGQPDAKLLHRDVQTPLSRLEEGQHLNDRYEAMEDRLAVRIY
jgi:hypothetical protein